MILALVAAATAAPDRVASAMQLGQSLSDLTVAADADWAAVTDENGYLHLLDLGTWDVQDFAICDNPGGVAAVPGSGIITFWVGCGDGTVESVVVDGDTRLGELGTSVDVGDGSVEAVETDGTSVYAVLKGESDTVVTGFDPDTGDVLSGFPTQALHTTGVEDTVLLGNVLVVVHGSTESSKVDLVTGSVSSDTNVLAGRDYVDGFGYSTGTVYLADAEDGGVVKLTVGTMEYAVGLNDVLASATALAFNSDAGWITVAGLDADDAGAVSVRDFTSGAIGSDELTSIAAPEMAELDVYGDYALGAATTGELDVLTDLPWVEITSDVPDVVVTGDTVTVTFTSDTEGSYEVFTDPADVLASGDIAAGGEATVDVTVPDSWEEGRNRLAVEVTATSGVGHDAIDLDVNNPPAGVEATTGFGNRAVVVDITGSDDEDLDYYCIYLTTTPFDPSDYATQGPEFDGEDAVQAPVRYSAAPGDDVEYRFEPLTNGVTYYVAVRAVDTSGLEGPMTDLMSATPTETYSVSELTGEDGGFFCGTTPRAGLAAVAIAAAALLRRRRNVAGAVVAAALVAPGIAHAKPVPETTPLHSYFDVRYGVFLPQDTYIQRGFGDNTNLVLRLDYGWSSRFVEAGLGLGGYHEKGYLYTAEGEKSSDEETFEILPVDATLTLRLNLLDEQFLVPFVRGGGDMWFWRENWDPVAGEDDDGVRYGGKFGGHWAAGAGFLLDALDPKGASRLEARSGINDTYIVGEYRQTYMIHSGDSVDLSAWEYTFGLKFDF